MPSPESTPATPELGVEKKRFFHTTPPKRLLIAAGAFASFVVVVLAAAVMQPSELAQLRLVDEAGAVHKIGWFGLKEVPAVGGRAVLSYESTTDFEVAVVATESGGNDLIYKAGDGEPMVLVSSRTKLASPTVSPDGSQVAVARFSPRDPMLLGSSNLIDWEVVLVTVADKSERSLGRGYRPEFLSDGALFYTTPGGIAVIKGSLLMTASMSVVPLTDASARPSHDGSHVLLFDGTLSEQVLYSVERGAGLTVTRLGAVSADGIVDAALAARGAYLITGGDARVVEYRAFKHFEDARRVRSLPAAPVITSIR